MTQLLPGGREAATGPVLTDEQAGCQENFIYKHSWRIGSVTYLRSHTPCLVLKCLQEDTIVSFLQRRKWRLRGAESLASSGKADLSTREPLQKDPSAVV